MEAFFLFFEKNLQLYSYELAMIPVGSILFCIFWFTMERFLFRPYLALIEAREELTVRSLERAEKAETLAEKLTTEFEDTISAVRLEAIREKAGVLTEAKKQAALILEKAAVNVEAKTRTHRRDLSERIEQIKEDVLKDSDQMAYAIAEKLKRPGNVVQ